MIASSRLILAAAFCVASTTAQATILVRVSGKGADAAGCGGVANPCRTLQFAHDQVDAGGYIVALDPADFGSLTVKKSLNLANESSGEARATPGAIGFWAINVTAPETDVFRLRGFTLDTRDRNSIVALTAKRLEIDAVTIRNTPGVGLYIYSRSDMSVVLRDTSISDGVDGIDAQLGYAFRYGSGFYASGLRVTNNSHRAAIFSSRSYSPVVLKDSLLSGNPSATEGIRVSSSLALARNITVSGFATGVPLSSSLLLLSRARLTSNVAALTMYDSIIESAGDNVIRGNADDTLGLVTPVALH